MAKLKSFTNIKKQSVEENLNHPILRCAALRMAEYTRESFPTFYRFLNYQVADASSDFSRLVDQEMLIKTSTNSSYYYAPYQTFAINPLYLFRIIKDIPGDEMENYLQAYDLRDIKNNDVAGQRQFALELHRFLSTGSISVGEFSDCKFFLSEISENPSYYAYGVIQRMLQSVDYTPFFESLPVSCLEYLAEIAIADYERMIDIDLDLHNRYIFFNYKGIAGNPYYALVYVLQNELMTNGHLDDLIEKYRDVDFVCRFLKAIRGIYNNDFTPIYEIMLGFVAEGTAYALEEPHMVLFYFAALLRDSSDKATKLALALSKKKLVKNTALLSALLAWKNTGKLQQKQIDNLSRTYYNPSTHVVFSLFALHCHMFPQRGQEPYFVSFYATQIPASSRMKYMKLLYAEEISGKEKLSDQMQQETGMTSVLLDGARKQKWQVMLENIVSQIRSSSGQQTASASRIAYLINPNGLYIRPILQKSTTGGSWTKGRSVALKSLKDGIMDGFTERDARVAAAVRFEHTWSGVSYYLDHRQALVALAGNPNVFTDDDQRLKVDVYMQPLELSVTKNKAGKFKLDFNVNPDAISGGYYIDSSNIYSIRIVEVSNKQLSIMHQLLSLGALPADAGKDLANTLTALGSVMTVMSDLVKSDGDTRVVEGSPVMVVQLIPDGGNIHAQVFAKPLSDNPPYLSPGKGSEFVSTRVGTETVQARRDIAGENANFNVVERLLQDHCNDQITDTAWLLTVSETLDVLAAVNAISDKAVVEWPEGARMSVSRTTLTPGDVHVKVKNAENWFEIEGKVEIGDGASLKVAEILAQMQQPATNPRFIRIGDTEYVELSDHLAKILRQLSQVAQPKGKHVRMSQFNALALDELDKVGADVAGDRAYKRMIKLIGEADNAVIRQPRGLRAELREYQKTGFKWMARLRMWGAGACLADDMGLGKTLQTITLMLAAKSGGPSLVVAPTSVLTNWKDEVERFAPALRPLVLNSASEAARAEIVSGASKGDVVITSYGLLVTQEGLLCAKEWNIAVLDEAHTIKNRGTKMSKSAMKLTASMRVALTGTPLQNRLSEIWNIFQFTNPGLLGSFESFTDRFITPIERDGDKDRQRVLKRMISPFLLRRTKKDVLSELPEKSEITLRIDLSEEERALYEKLRREAEMSVEAGDGSPVQMLAQLTRLRQAACNPRLIFPDIRMESSKGVAFISLVEDLIANNHRALVFSQFTSHLSLIMELLDKKKISYLYLDGSTPGARRQQLVEEFQTGDTPLFLISLKAGGLGLNLTGADYVIHLDPWWNPAIEDQASDRSYRIGQEKHVTVYRIIAANTIEDKILRLHKHKKSLADALLEGSDMSARLTKDDILDLLKEK